MYRFRGLGYEILGGGIIQPTQCPQATRNTSPHCAGGCLWSCPPDSAGSCDLVSPKRCRPPLPHPRKCPCNFVVLAARLFATPWTAACQAPLSFTVSPSLRKFMSIALVMPSNRLILCCPLLLPLIPWKLHLESCPGPGEPCNREWRVALFW